MFIAATNDSRFRVCREDRKAALGNPAGGERTHQPDHLHGTRRAAVCGADCGGRRRVLDGGSSNSLVAFALPDVRRKPLRCRFSRAVAAAAAARRNQPRVGAFVPAVLPAGGAKELVAKTCAAGCHSWRW